jgi:hypothetical protein
MMADKTIRETINELIKNEKGPYIISENSPDATPEQREWARQGRLMTEYKSATDVQSKLVQAYRKGEHKTAIKVAKAAKKEGLSADFIADITDLPLAEIALL